MKDIVIFYSYSNDYFHGDERLSLASEDYCYDDENERFIFIGVN